MSQLQKNAIAYLQKKFRVATILNQENTFLDVNLKPVFKVCPMIAQDSNSGIKQKVIVIDNLGSKGELLRLAKSITSIFEDMDKGVYIRPLNDSDCFTGHEIDTTQMTFASRVIIYTNRSVVPIKVVMEVFETENMLIEVIEENKLHKTLFISYGGPDEKFVTEINNKLKAKGVTTWFFPDDAPLGNKLHRVMHEGVNKHDHVLLVCSESSLSRNGVLNEIERVLEREAREGGSEILLPITIDDYVFTDWSPSRTDIAEQIKARVITRITSDQIDLDKCIDRITSALKLN